MSDADDLVDPSHELVDLVRPPSDKVGRAVARARIAEKLFATSELVRLGRYHLLEKVGAGAMGVVWGAWDPELERRVAIKLLKPELQSSRERILREGQALGKLSHPNVVPIYDVGVVDDQVYLVMEWIAGDTLRGWAAARHTLRERLDLLTAVGDGLASVHAAGLVHRDVKPDNILVGRDDRARLSDLGLALENPDASSATAEGTPAYMAPEQIAGNGVDARADQFAYCVCAWELLFGQRPFPDSPDERRAATERGVVAPARSGVPGHVIAVIARGLSAAPDSRWPSMAALVAALRRDPRQRLRIASIALVGIGLTAGLTALLVRGDTRDDPCASGALDWKDTWNATERSALVAALGSDARWRTIAADRTSAMLDAYGERWKSVHHAVCSARGGAGVQAARTSGLRCLDDRRRSVDAALELLATGGATLALSAPQLVGRLAPPEPCSDANATETSPRAAAERAALRARLDRARSALVIGLVRAKVPAVQALVTEIEKFGDAGLLASARAVLGLAQTIDGQGARGRAELRRAYFLARDVRDGFTAADVATSIALGELAAGRLDLADDWSRLALADAAALGHNQRVRAVEPAIKIALTRRDATRAEALVAQANIDATAGGDEDGFSSIAEARSEIHVLRGRYAEAIAAHEQALADISARQGEDSPRYAVMLSSLAEAHTQAGNNDKAIELRTRAVAIADAALGPDSQIAAEMRSDLGGTLYHAQRYEQAAAVLASATAVLERGDSRAAALNNSALVRERLGDPKGAIADYRTAIELWTHSFGEYYADIGIAYGNVGLALLNQDLVAESIPELERSVVIWDHNDPDSPEAAFPLSTLGSALNAAHRFAEAKVVLERARRLRDRPDIAPGHRANTLLELAVATYNLGEKAKGRALAVQSRALYLEADRPDMVKQLDALIAQLRP